MEENNRIENENAAGNIVGAKSESKPKQGFWMRMTDRRNSTIALTAVIALVAGLLIGHCVHRRHCGGERCCRGEHAMMMHRGFGHGWPRWGGRFERDGRGNGGMRDGRGNGGMHGSGGQMGMMDRPGMGPMGMQHGFDPAERAEHLKQELGLNDQQAAQIKGIFEQIKSKMDAGMNNHDSASHNIDWKANREQMEAQIKAVLTPDQQAKWQQQMAGRMDRGR